MSLNYTQFRRRFVGDKFVDVVAVPPGVEFKREYEAPRRKMLGRTLAHYSIVSTYRAAETPEWVYTMFGIARPRTKAP